TVVGRDRACEIVVSDHRVSKRHFKITRKNEGVYIEDLSSTNGTRVGNRDLTEVRRLEGGELIGIGDTELIFSETGSSILSVVDISSTDDGMIAQVRPQEKLQAILEIARELGGTINLDGVLRRVMETLFRILPQAGRVLILLKGERTDELIVKASKCRG